MLAGAPLTHLARPEPAGAVPVEGTHCASSPESGLSTQTGLSQPLGGGEGGPDTASQESMLGRHLGHALPLVPIGSLHGPSSPLLLQNVITFIYLQKLGGEY